MNKIEQIRKMLDYLSKRNNSDITQFTPNVFQGMEHFIKKESKKDCQSISVDFNKKLINYYSYNESYHNGNHYACSTELEQIDVLENYYDAIYNKTCRFIEIEMIEAEKRKEQFRIQNQSKIRLEQLISD